jgi:hypothetical protein
LEVFRPVISVVSNILRTWQRSQGNSQAFSRFTRFIHLHYGGWDLQHQKQSNIQPWSIVSILPLPQMRALKQSLQRYLTAHTIKPYALVHGRQLLGLPRWPKCYDWADIMVALWRTYRTSDILHALPFSLRFSHLCCRFEANLKLAYQYRGWHASIDT